MFIFILLLLLIMFLQMKPAPIGEFHRDTYMSREQTTSINGIFVAFVFVKHTAKLIRKFVETGSILNMLYYPLDNYLTQLCVVTFLFYSGYGIMESIKKKGMPYVYGIPWQRLFRVWYHFAIAIVLYILTNIILGRPMEPVKVLLSFVDWFDLGNNNWYVFAYLMMYVAVFLAFLAARRFYFLGVVFVSTLTVGYILWVFFAGMPARFYDTIILFPLGMLYSLLKPYLDKFFMLNEIVYFGSLAVVTAGFIFMGRISQTHLLAYYGFAVLFMMLIVLITMKFQIQNPILNWLGTHIFSIYILQRIPMIFLREFGLTSQHPYLFVILSFVITLFLAVLYDFLIGKLDGLIYRKRKQPESALKH